MRRNEKQTIIIGRESEEKKVAGRTRHRLVRTTFIVTVFSFKDLKTITCVIGIRGSFLLMKCGKGGPERLSNVFEVTRVWIPGPAGTQGRDVGEQGCEPSSPPCSHWLVYSTETNGGRGQKHMRKTVTVPAGAGNPESGRGKHSFQI